MECRAYGICLDSQSRGYLGKDRKVSSAAEGNLSRMHKTEETAKESRLNFMYSHLRNRTLEASGSVMKKSSTIPYRLNSAREIVLSALSPKGVTNPVRQPSAPSTQAAVAAGPPPCTTKSRAGCFSPGVKWSGNCTRTSTTLTPTAKASRGANSFIIS